MLDWFLDEGQDLQPWSPLASNEEQHDEISPLETEDIVLHEPEYLLTQYPRRYGESAIQTFEEEFKVAMVAEMNGNQERAVYHCEQILRLGDPQVIVQTFVGIVYLNTSRPEDAISSLFLALTDFILEFTSTTSEANLLRLQSIESLFSRLSARNGKEWEALSACMRQMTDTILEAVRDAITDEIFPKLLVHGISFAHELYILEDEINTEQMYESLLSHSAGTYIFAHGIQFTMAHREYGLLLKNRGNWIGCGEQLLLTCDFALYSGPHEGQLIANLRCDCFDVLLHLHSESSDSDVPDRVDKALTRLRRNYPRINDNSESRQLSRVEEYFLSDLPFVSVLSQHHEASLSRTVPPMQELRNDTSTASKSTGQSHRYGVTFSESEITGISNSAFYTP